MNQDPVIPIDTQRIINAALKNATQRLRNESRTIPAPCGCAPNKQCMWHTDEPHIGGWQTPAVRVGARVVFRHPDGTTQRGVVTRTNPDGTFTLEPEPEAAFGWLVPPGTDICPRCGDQNYIETTRECITCTPGLPGHDPELLERIMRLKNGGSRSE